MKTAGIKKIGKYKVIWHSYNCTDKKKYLRAIKIAIADGIKILWCKEYANHDKTRITPGNRDIIINNVISMAQGW